MSIFNGINNFLMLINNHWTEIVIAVGLALSIVKKLKDYLMKSDDEKIQIAKSQISTIILKLVSDAEDDYSDWVKAGAIKRSQVIEYIFSRYPVLEHVIDQNKLVKEIDGLIDSALDEMRDIINKNA